jgi:MFS family permease
MPDDQQQSSEPAAGAGAGLLSKAALPVFSAFFLWGFGTGALWMVRPLTAFDLGGSVFLVGVVAAFSAAPRMFGAPIAGSLADRVGRRPVVIAGAFFHGAAVAGQAFVTSYELFLLLEFVSGFGVAIWVTGSSALLADFTRVSNRGRGVALRNTSMRLGILMGPAAGGIVAALFDLQAVFLFIAVTKVGVIIISWFLIAETRQPKAEEEPITAPSAVVPKARLRVPDLSVFKTRDFFILGVMTLALGLVTAGPGAFRTFFPVHAQAVGLSVADIGTMISVSGLAAMLIALPVGAMVDMRGRKPLLIAGLGILALSLYLIVGMEGLVMGLAVAVAFGIGEVVGTNTNQTYAMDLAPADRRGYFLGTWQATMNVGQLIGPLIVGWLATEFSLPTAFAIIATVLVACAVFVGVFGRETHVAGGEPSVS